MITNPKEQNVNPQSSGFTLVELLIVVVIITAIGMVAVPTFRGLVVKSKESEALQHLGMLSKNAATFYHKSLHKHFPLNTGVSYYKPEQTPSDRCAKHGSNLYPANHQSWGTEPWSLLNFTIDGEHFFQYRWYGGPSKATGKDAQYYIYAYADMDCDGTYSSRSYHGHIDKLSGEVVRDQMHVLEAGE